MPLHPVNNTTKRPHVIDGRRYRLSTCLFAHQEEARSSVAVFCGRTGHLVRLHGDVWSSLCHTGSQLDGSIVRALRDHGLLVPEEMDEFTSVMAENRHHAALRHHMVYSVIPTADCNLRCDYCGQKHHSTTMNESVIAATALHIRSMLEATRVESLGITWFGAEPVLAMDVIRTLSRQLIRACNDAGVSYGATLVTNGTLLTPEDAGELVNEYGLSNVEVTLDGPPEVHDARRPFGRAQSDGSYATTFKNLCLYAQLPLEALQINIRCNIDRRNSASAAALLEAVCAAGLRDRVAVYLSPVHVWGEAKGQAERMTFADFATIELQFIKAAAAMGIATTPVLPSRKHVTCFHTAPRSLLVDPVGRLCTCTEIPLTPGHDSNLEQCAMWSVGTVYDNELIHKPKVSPWHDEAVIRKSPCGRCAAFGVCGGRCPRRWMEGHGECPPFRHNLLDRIAVVAATSEFPLIGVSVALGTDAFLAMNQPNTGGMI